MITHPCVGALQHNRSDFRACSRVSGCRETSRSSALGIVRVRRVLGVDEEHRGNPVSPVPQRSPRGSMNVARGFRTKPDRYDPTERACADASRKSSQTRGTGGDGRDRLKAHEVAAQAAQHPDGVH